MSVNKNQIAAYNIHEESTEGLYCFGQDSITERIMKAMSDRSDKIDFMRKSLRKANVLTRVELEKRIGMDIVESMKGLDTKGQSELAKRIEDNIVLFIKSTNPNIAKVRNEELLNEPIAVDTFRAVVVAWLINASLFLSFGKVRYEVIRDAWHMRNNMEHLSLEYVRGLLTKNISLINAQMKRHVISDLIDRMGKLIDKEVVGSLSVVEDKDLYNRNIEPRLQQYRKKVMEVSEKELGEIADKVVEISQDIAFARQDPALPRWRIFEEFRRKAWGASVSDAVLMAEYGSFIAVSGRVMAKRPADLIDFYDDDEVLVQSLVTAVAKRALKNSDFEDVPGAFEDAYQTAEAVVGGERGKQEGQRLLWQLMRGDACCCSPMLDSAYEKVISLLERSEKLKRNRIALRE